MIPIAAFTGTNKVPKILHLHTFGCPAYVLVNELQSKKKIDKWRPRCRVGIYLGPSPSHASSIHLIMSPVTRHISPQFHVSFDDLFETIKQGAQHIKYGWQAEAGIQQKSVTFDDAISNVQHNLPNISIHGHETTTEQPEGGNTEHHRMGPDGEYGTDHQPGHEGPNWEEGVDVEIPDLAGPEDEDEPPANASPRESSHMATANASPREASHGVTIRSRYGRIIKPTTRMVESREQARTRRNQSIALYGNVADLNVSLSVNVNQTDDNMDDPIALSSQVGDTMHLHQAMKQPDRDKFLKAMEEEVTTHERRGHWKIVPIAAVPKGEKILDSVWAMRRK